jgi:adenylate kinase family enzyme
MERILVGGSSGAGKTTMARALSARLDLPHAELDALFHGPNWTPRPEFVADVDAFTSQPRWVVDHDYAAARHLVWARIDTFVWLDYSRWVCEARVIRRSIGRGLLRQELWNGNRESPWRWHRASHPIRWSWSHHERKRADFESRVADAANAHVAVIRLRTPRDAAAWLASVGRPRQ